MNICDLNKCTGCGACLNCCPVDAISMKADEFGFLYPYIDEALCIKCGKCKAVCPMLGEVKKEAEPEAYAFKLNDLEIRKRSSSGGFFGAIAKYVLDKNGVVYGAAIDDEFKVCHCRVDDEARLDMLRGSKYIQSDTGKSFREAKVDLEQDKYVLFSGTPCQISALKKYLGKEYDKLITMDFICHGVPSPKLWQEFIADVQKKHNKSIKNIICRDMGQKWGVFMTKVEFNNEIIYTDEYLKLYLSNYIIRESCFNCRFTTTRRVSDFTAADFWGLKQVLPEMHDDAGVSMVFFNSEKARRLYNEISVAGEMKKTEISKVMFAQPHLSRQLHKTRIYNIFWKDYKKYGYEYVYEKYIVRLYGRRLKLFVAGMLGRLKKGLKK